MSLDVGVKRAKAKNQSLTKLWEVNNQLLLLGHVGLNFLFFIPWFDFYMFAIVSSSVMLIVEAQICGCFATIMGSLVLLFS